MFTSFDVFVIFVIFYISLFSDLVTSDDGLSEDNDVKVEQAFNKLLYDLVNLNQERLKAINRVFDLEERPVSGGLRSSVEDGQENPLVLFIFNHKNTIKEDNYNNDLNIPDSLYAHLRTASEDLSTSNENADGNGVKAVERMAVLRGWNSCKKAAVKSCKGACNKAWKTVCSDYECTRRMKKAIKKECKNACDNKFHDRR